MFGLVAYEKKSFLTSGPVRLKLSWVFARHSMGFLRPTDSSCDSKYSNQPEQMSRLIKVLPGRIDSCVEIL